MIDIDYQKDVDHFIDVVSKDKDANLTIFYNNLKTLKFVNGSSELFNMGYDNRLNQIFFANKEIYDSAIYHELFHAASTIIDGPTYISGLSLWNSETKHIFGLGLNEGYTELLQRRFFNIGEGYHLQRFFIEKLEEIIDPGVIKKAYFDTNIKSVIEALGAYAPPEKIEKFISGLDIYTIHMNPYKKSVYTDEIVQKYVTYCSSFLGALYARKMVQEQPENFTEKIFNYFSSFERTLVYPEHEPINVSIPLKTGVKILEKVGFERK